MHEKIVVTGGLGFIGSHLIEWLSGKGHEIVVFDNLSTGYLQNISGVIDRGNIINGDIRDFEQLRKAVSGARYVFHLAALSYVSESIKKPQEYNSVNIDGTFNVLSACKAEAVQRVIFPSSCIVYGNSDISPIPESEPSKPHIPYGLTKMAGEFYCKFFYEIHGLETISLRIFNAYGPRMQQRVISKFAEKMLENKSPLVNGDGEQKRDFIYVTDIVEGLVKAMGTHKKNCGKSFNIGTGKGITLKNLIAKMNEAWGTDIPIKLGDPVSGETDEIIADTTLAEKELGFKAKMPLNKGLKITMEWLKEAYKTKKSSS